MIKLRTHLITIIMKKSPHASTTQLIQLALHKGTVELAVLFFLNTLIFDMY